MSADRVFPKIFAWFIFPEDAKDRKLRPVLSTYKISFLGGFYSNNGTGKKRQMFHGSLKVKQQVVIHKKMNYETFSFAHFSHMIPV